MAIGMKKDNRGYSLVELIVVIVILALLSGTALFSISIIFGASAKACANGIKEALAETKVTAMGKSEARLQISRSGEDDCIYVTQQIKNVNDTDWKGSKVDEKGDAVTEKIGNSRVSVTYKKEGEALQELKQGESIYLSFDRGNGSFSNKSEDCILCEEIYVRGGSRSYKLTLTELTGKVTIELE